MRQYSLLAVLSVSMVVIATAFVKKETEHPDKHLEIVLRNIGHLVLPQELIEEKVGESLSNETEPVPGIIR
ncbi:hypothetical protein A4H97_00065 [Niastella yeongjuensis]|uniref:Uncharacterized protein n=1 Tax=Niastella yeongjuensis TaxID=354355 RepID=A0A1V9EVW9_9BACT|nr:hypothetical protein [Niastella yeongjuensis]OQP50279.1 hypothetical protein A4H97_00065 [Niastella yeongjuensis]SEN41415.1 hypothetical protein SAMN05660816_00938 [Niastella yeongjuensis]